MKHGFFMMPVHHPSKGLARTIKEDMDTIIDADRLGYDEAWIGEHYTIPWENIPGPELFIAKALGLTKNIKLGTGVILLQLHDPLMLAHHMVVLDHLAEGRFLFGVGTGGVPTEFELFGILQEERHARAIEVLDIVLKIWESDGDLDYKGKFHHIKAPEPWPEIGLSLYAKPFTKPHPPIAVACSSRNSPTAEWAGEYGWWPMSGGNLPFPVVATHWEAYERGARKAGLKPDRKEWRVSRDIHVAETTEQARREAFTMGMTRSYDEYFFPLFRRQPNGLAQVKLDPDMPDDDVTVEYMMDNNWIVGDPDYCISRIKELYDTVGGFGTLLQLTHDWDDPGIGHKSRELFMKHVAPALNEL